MRVALLAGGTGAAKLAVGFQAILGPGELSVVTNTADDVDFWGLRVCPDTDSVLFRLAGIFNERAGFGVADETFNVHGQMRRLDEPDWFWLGDRDLAFHLVRTDLLRRGARLTETALELGPSNPLISIAPITSVLAGAMRRERTVAISPIVGGRALKGPTVEMMLA